MYKELLQKELKKAGLLVEGDRVRKVDVERVLNYVRSQPAVRDAYLKQVFNELLREPLQKFARQEGRRTNMVYLEKARVVVHPYSIEVQVQGAAPFYKFEFRKGWISASYHDGEKSIPVSEIQVFNKNGYPLNSEVDWKRYLRDTFAKMQKSLRE